jgi:phage-related protein (TIGR01555 family)
MSKQPKPNAAQRMGERVRQQTARVATGDSFTNFAARLGYGAGSQQDGSRFSFDAISRNRVNLEYAYRSNWVCGLAVDVVAKDMTRAGVEFHNADMPPDRAEKLHKAMESLRIWKALCDTSKWARLYGGAIAVMLIDGQDPRTPLNVERISRGQFKGLLVLDRWQIQPTLEDQVRELGPELGMPTFYDVLPAARAMAGQRIHYSRVIRMDGLELPHWQRLAENGWGQSIIERLYDRIVNFDSASAGVGQLVYKAHLRVVKIKGLRETIALGGKAAEGVAKQLEMIRQYQSNEGLTVLDAEDEFEAHSYTFSGLDNVLLQFGQQISGATQIPLVRLFGQSPAGLNSTGDSDLRTYYDNVAQQQDELLRPGIMRLFSVLHPSTFGTALPEGFAFEFVPLWQMTPEQKATVAKETTEAIVSAEGAGIISQQVALKELRHASRQTGVFTNITDEDINAAEDEPPAPGEGVDPGAEVDAAGKPIEPGRVAPDLKAAA